MTPTLSGRLQTRVFVAATAGLLWTAIIAAALPRPAGLSAGSAYRIALEALGLMTAAGLGWELVYHVLQQGRWDKDWPSLFALVTVLNEAVALWFVLHAVRVIHGTTGWSSPALPFYASYVATTWLAVWLFTQGPIRVLHLRWRFEGGQVIMMRHSGRCRRMCDVVMRRRGAAGARPATQDGTRPAAQDGTRPATQDGTRPATQDAKQSAGMTPAADRAPIAPRQAAPRQADPPGDGELVEGIRCHEGHFCHPALRYCAICGTQLRPLRTGRVLGVRPPVGILIFDDGTTRVLEQDMLLTKPAAGPLTLRPVSKRSRARGAAVIRISGWTPVAWSWSETTVVILPVGCAVPAGRGVPVPLLPGSELWVAGERLRFDSPYPPAGGSAYDGPCSLLDTK